MAKSQKNLHIALFPFMSKGHTIPLLHLTKLIHQHRPHATFTIFTTPSNQPFISTSLSSLPSTLVNIITLPFDNSIGVESTDQLPSMSLFHSFVFETESLLPLFEETLEKLQNVENPDPNPITFLISDFFLYWTHDVTSKFDIPRLCFSGMSVYAMVTSILVFVNKIFDGVESSDEAVQLPGFDSVRLTKNDFDSSFNGPDSNGIVQDFLMKVSYSCSMSYAYLVNSFEELELGFVKHYNSNYHPKSKCIGPFCLAENPKINDMEKEKEKEKPFWMDWLNEREKEGKPVLYIAFGTQAEITNDQLKEMALGLENSEANFIWALRVKPGQEEILKGLEERVSKKRGMVVRGWVDQKAILEHESVKGFLSHCGWNSVIEGVSRGVPILAWPMMADQYLNARLVVDEIKVGLRVESCDGSVKGFVKWEGLCKMVKELMEGELGEIVRGNATRYGLMANKAINEGGSSWSTLDVLLNELESIDVVSKTSEFIVQDGIS